MQSTRSVIMLQLNIALIVIPLGAIFTLLTRPILTSKSARPICNIESNKDGDPSASCVISLPMGGFYWLSLADLEDSLLSSISQAVGSVEVGNKSPGRLNAHSQPMLTFSCT